MADPTSIWQLLSQSPEAAVLSAPAPGASEALVHALTQGRGLGMADPSGQTMRAPRWYEHPALAQIPNMSWLGPLLSGSPTAIPPQEGVQPVEGMADPVTQLAFLMAPGLKAFVGRQGGTAPDIRTVMANQRGAFPVGDGENTLDAFKRMFLERGGVESGAGQARAARQSASEYAQQLKADPSRALGHPISPEMQAAVQRPEVQYWARAPVRPLPEHGWQYSASGLQSWREGFIDKGAGPEFDAILRQRTAIPLEAQQELVNLSGSANYQVWRSESGYGTTRPGIQARLADLGIPVKSPQAALKTGYVAKMSGPSAGYYQLTPLYYKDVLARMGQKLAGGEYPSYLQVNPDYLLSQ